METSESWRKGKAGGLGLPLSLLAGGRLPGQGLLLQLLNKCNQQTPRSLSLYFQFLAFIQVINKNQPHKTQSHPLLLLPAYLPGCGNRSGVRGREWPMPLGRNENWLREGEASNRKRNKLKALYPLQPGFSSFPQLPGEQKLSAAPDVCLFPLCLVRWYSRAAGSWVGPRLKNCTMGTGRSRNVEIKLVSRSMHDPVHLGKSRDL